MVGVTGLEPVTPSLSSQKYLSTGPKWGLGIPNLFISVQDGTPNGNPRWHMSRLEREPGSHSIKALASPGAQDNALHRMTETRYT
jgi:hypothetical protein